MGTPTQFKKVLPSEIWGNPKVLFFLGPLRIGILGEIKTKVPN